MNVVELKEAIHAIVTIRQRIPGPREIYYQVTLDPAKVSPSREYIRLGEIAGDEFTGWVKVEDVSIIEVLGEFDPGEVATYYSNRPHA